MGAMVDRPPIWLELLIYIGLGFLWALPFKFIFKGVVRPTRTPRPAVARPGVIRFFGEKIGVLSLLTNEEKAEGGAWPPI
ncbi:MAG: DUF2842 domain-containing protein [Gemmobacter sp.]|nr:DUF2842 domain-containing protein [Gemmobacter sp.]